VGEDGIAAYADSPFPGMWGGRMCCIQCNAGALIPQRGNENVPTQHLVKELKADWNSTDILVCRCDLLPSGLKAEDVGLCDVPVECVITAQDASSIYC